MTQSMLMWGGWKSDRTVRSFSYLARRAGFGMPEDRLQRAITLGLPDFLEQLLEDQRENNDFLSAELLLRQRAEASESIAHLRSWWFYRLYHSANPLKEKMSLLWHNHFATSHAKVQSVTAMAQQNDVLRQHALGDFRDLLHAMSRDVAMLIWLDGNANRKRAANENFARELMELFSLGVGNYSEADIQEAARAFTGWHVRQGKYWFNSSQHDDGIKKVFQRRGSFNGNDIVDLCLEHPACSRFVSYKLLRMFVCDQPLEGDVSALADTVKRNQYQLKPILRTLFSSQLFWNERSRTGLIKSPVDLAVGLHQSLAEAPDVSQLASVCGELGQLLFEPPSVKGWEGGKLWINSAYFLRRANYIRDMISRGRVSQIAAELSNNQKQPSELLAFWSERLLSPELSPRIGKRLLELADSGAREQRDILRSIVLLPEFQLA